MTRLRRASVVATLAALACRPPTPPAPPAPSADQRVTNLYAFARLYGAIRWFHPSDAAAEADWDQLAIDGVRRVIDVHDRGELVSALRDLFSPVAPTVRIAASDDPLWQTTGKTPAPPSLPANQEAVAWQHKGYGDSSFRSGYLSKRRHRPRTIPEPLNDDDGGSPDPC